MRSRKLVAIGVLWFLLLGMGPVFHARASVRRSYKQARARYEHMNRAPERYQDRDWRKLAGRFRSIYFRYPTSGYADDAVFFEAEIYRFLYNRTNRIEDWKTAVRKYKFLVQEYPSSSLIPRALLAVAYLYQRRGIAEWRDYLRRCEEKYRRHCRELSDYRVLQGVLRAERTRRRTPATQWSTQLSRLEDIRAFPSHNYTRVVLYLSRAVLYRPGILRNPDRLYIDLDETRLSGQVRKARWTFGKRDYLKGIRVGQFLPDTARVVLDFDHIKMHRIFTLENPFRIVIDVFQQDWQPMGRLTAHRPTAKARLPAGQPQESTAPVVVPEENSNGQYSLYRQMGMKASRIMIDPGHGGHDPGAIGVRGLKEKDVTLRVAKMLKAAIERRWNVEVLMTRMDDRFVPLEERTAMANTLGADLFISIHANASRSNRARGVETYYLQWARDEHAMEVAARENAVTTARMHELKKFIRMILQNPKVEESRDLASYIQKGLVGSLKAGYKVKDLGIKTAPFYVLMGAEMPAVLVEIAFITHPEEGKRLRDEKYLQRIVQGIIRGLERYLDAQGSLELLAK